METKQIVKMLLLEGNPNGRIMCNLDNWIGNSYKIPRALVKNSTDRPDLSYTGIYILFGMIDEKEVAYIGEAEDVYYRLRQHLDKKEFWNECLVFVSKDNNLNKAHVKYIENKLYNYALKAERYIVENKTIPTESTLSEFDLVDMDKFIENIKLVTSMYGYKIFDEIIPVDSSIDESQLLFINKKEKGVFARAVVTEEGFVVLKGSKVSPEFTNGTTECFKVAGAKLREKGVIDSDNIFIKDHVFSSPSGAAVIVVGRNSNGLTEWKNIDGKSLKELGY